MSLISALFRHTTVSESNKSRPFVIIEWEIRQNKICPHVLFNFRINFAETESNYRKFR